MWWRKCVQTWVETLVSSCNSLWQTVETLQLEVTPYLSKLQTRTSRQTSWDSHFSTNSWEGGSPSACDLCNGIRCNNHEGSRWVNEKGREVTFSEVGWHLQRRSPKDIFITKGLYIKWQAWFLQDSGIERIFVFRWDRLTLSCWTGGNWFTVELIWDQKYCLKNLKQEKNKLKNIFENKKKHYDKTACHI